MNRTNENPKGMGLATRIVLVAAVVIVAVVAVNYVVFVRGYRVRAQEALVERARAFTAVADEAKNHASVLHRTGAIDVETLSAELKSDLAAGKKVSESRLFATIPIVAGWTAAREAARRENTEFRITAFDARDSKNEPRTGSFEEKLLRRLTDEVAAGKSEVVSGVDEASNFLHVMRAIRLTENCMACHGAPGSSWDTEKNGKDVTGHAMEGWRVGDMHGSYHVILPLAPVEKQVAAFLFSGMAWTGPMLLGALGVLVLLCRTLIRKPLHSLKDRMQAIAAGDLTQEIPGELLARADEVGEQARALGALSDAMRESLTEVMHSTETLGEMSESLVGASDRLSRRARNATEQSETVAAAAEESSVNAASVAAGMEQAATNLASVAAATEELSATVAEIAGTSARARTVGDEASSQAQAVAALVHELGQSAQAIGKVTETITNISAQTNLLALNATIEAARAGAAGKGFAVVAHEIKELAQQTAAATEDIKSKVAGVQMSTGNAISDIEKIAGVIREVGQLVASIATSIEEQTTVTKDVAANISQASEGIRDANQRITETATAAKSIAAEIAKVSEEGRATNEDSSALQTDADRLRAVTGRFQQLAGRFDLGTSHPSDLGGDSDARDARGADDGSGEAMSSPRWNRGRAESVTHPVSGGRSGSGSRRGTDFTVGSRH